MSHRLCDYVEGLYKAEDFEAAFDIFEREVKHLGFDGVLYTYIPKLLITSNFQPKPVYHVSHDYSPGYMRHYADARFDKHDPLIRAVNDGVQAPIEWWGEICESYKQSDSSSREVIEASRSYGIYNGVTLPLGNHAGSIAGASFISEDSLRFPLLLEEKLDDLVLRTRLFHNLVLSNACFLGEFTRPIVASFSKKQLQYLAGLAAGKKTSEIATELHTSTGYLDQAMLKLRRKLSGVGEFDAPTITRNQILYYAGLLNILENGPDDSAL